MYKISVIVPSLNVVRFIDKCLSNLVNQTLKDIEVICVDAHSNDGTLEIIKNYQKKYNNIKLILSDKKSYGYQMNLGLACATGEYIGIAEPDDFPEINMFERLYWIAVSKKCDVVKSQWKEFYTNSDTIYYKSFVPYFLLNKKIDPLKCSHRPFIISYIFNMPASIWSAIYRREMLTKNDIIFNETPGASFQDTSFCYKVFSCADSIYFIDDKFVNYRLDNPSSSINDSKTKDYCIVSEIEEIRKFIFNKNLFNKKHMKGVFGYFKYFKYNWNYNRIISSNKNDFLNFFIREMKNDYEKGLLKNKYFTQREWNNLIQLIKNRKADNLKFKILNNRYYLAFRTTLRAGIKFVVWKRKSLKKHAI